MQVWAQRKVAAAGNATRMKATKLTRLNHHFTHARSVTESYVSSARNTEDNLYSLQINSNFVNTFELLTIKSG